MVVEAEKHHQIPVMSMMTSSKSDWRCQDASRKSCKRSSL